MQQSFARWTSGRTNATWPSMISSPAETEMSPGSRPTLRFLLSIMGFEVTEDPTPPMDFTFVQVLNDRKQRFDGPDKVVLDDLLRPGHTNETDKIIMLKFHIHRLKS
jgi:hypothetical protein